MPLYRAHYTREGREHDITFAANSPEDARVYAHQVLAKVVAGDIERIEEFSPRPYCRQRTLWETAT